MESWMHCGPAAVRGHTPRSSFYTNSKCLPSTGWEGCLLLVLWAPECGSYQQPFPACESPLQIHAVSGNEVTVLVGFLKSLPFSSVLYLLCTGIHLLSQTCSAFLSRCAGRECLAIEHCSSRGGGAGWDSGWMIFRGSFHWTQKPFLFQGSLCLGSLLAILVLESWGWPLCKRINSTVILAAVIWALQFHFFSTFPFILKLAEQKQDLWMSQGVLLLSPPVRALQSELEGGSPKQHISCAS